MRLSALLLVAALTTGLFADHKVFTDKSEPFADSSVVSKKEIFFGELKEYRKSLSEIKKALAVRGVLGAVEGLDNQAATLARGFIGEGLKGAGTGAAVGVVIALLDPIVMSAYADQYYILLYKVKLRNGRSAFMNRFLIGDGHPDLSKDEARKILGGKQ